MITKITLNKNKALKTGKSINEYYDMLDQFFSKYEIVKINTGIYSSNHFGHMAKAQSKLCYLSWFFNVVETWHCNFYSNDLSHNMENCLLTHYQFEFQMGRIKQIPAYVLDQVV